MKPGAENRSENSFKMGTLDKGMAPKMDIIAPFFFLSGPVIPSSSMRLWDVLIISQLICSHLLTFSGSP